jgi:hypothetical protein
LSVFLVRFLRRSRNERTMSGARPLPTVDAFVLAKKDAGVRQTANEVRNIPVDYRAPDIPGHEIGGNRN